MLVYVPYAIFSFAVCSIPPEYCIFNPPDLYADCLRWQAKCHTELLPEGASVDDMLAKLNLHNSGSGGKINSSGDGRAGANAAAGEGESTGEGEEDDGNGREEDECGKKKKGGPKGIKKKETASGGKVLIMRMSRNKRKSITVVTGLDSYPDLKLKDVAKALGKAFASGASVSDTGSGGKEIVIQGDVIDSLAIMLEEKYKVGTRDKYNDQIIKHVVHKECQETKRKHRWRTPCVPAFTRQSVKPEV
ncbi:translation machinery-associated protein 22 [Nannochloropsis gaditana]|uniref:Translation machinery-associated protein 22 n=1 Tax=Nannochloropsis gaditana TaxID=72520 RepID=W7U735_9STRA|nr:translation machinery-associated protein 22 [Nannochloropsis gaditana]